jgi:hypothetical protein
MTMTTVPPTALPAPPDGPMGGEVVYITPELAEQMLGHNTHNRNPRPGAVAAYAEDMAAGDWRWTGDPIRFAVDGTLLDGQHRLLAILRSGITLPLLVIRGLAPEAQEDIDCGVPRKYADVLSLRGEVNAHALAAIIRQVHTWTSGHRGTSKSSKATAAQLNRTLDAHPELRDITRASNVISSRWDMPQSLVGLCWWLFAAIDQEDADAFMHRCADGQNLAAGDPIYELRKQVAASRDHRGERSQRYLLAITIKAWNAYRKGDKVGQLKFRAGGAKPEAFPEPI